MTLRKTYDITNFKALDEEAGTFEAIVSVFGVVDFQGDRVMSGAFEKSIASWREKNAPIPIIWSHEWSNPFAHIGYADPADVEEVGAAKAGGTPAGLLVRGKLDIDKPFAKQVYDLLKDGRVSEWSFAYDVVREKKGEDQANELHVLNIIEAGPTLKGANSDTLTLGVKSQLDQAAKVETDAAVLAMAMDIDPELAKALMNADTVTVEKVDEPVSEEPDGEKATKAVYEQLDGSFEDVSEKLRGAVQVWADGQFGSASTDEPYGGPYACIVGTFPDRVDVAVEGLEDGTKYFEFAYTVGDDGAIDLGDPAEIDITVAVVEKSEPPVIGTVTVEVKAGRVIGASTASALKTRLSDVVDAFIDEVNGTSDAAAADGEASVEPEVKADEEPETPEVNDEIAAFKAQLDALVA